LARGGGALTLIALAVAGVLLVAAVFLGLVEARVGWSGSTLPNRIHYTYLLFTGSESSLFTVEAGKTLVLSYDVEVEGGSLTIKVRRGVGQTIWERSFHESSSGSAEIGLEEAGAYFVVVKGEAARGGFDVRWEVR